MNTCDTCKWWNAPTKHVATNGDGSKTLWFAIMGECINPSLHVGYERHREGEEPKAAPNEAACNVNGYINCGPKFGCVLHAP